MPTDALTRKFFEALATPESLVQALDRIAELEAQVDEARDAVIAATNLAVTHGDMVRELQAQLAAVPRWTRITSDPETWPPSDRSKVVNAFIAFTGDWELEVRSSDYFRLAIEGMMPLEHVEYWLPVTPPEADNGN